MILLWGVRNDPPLAVLEAALRDGGAEPVFLDQRDHIRDGATARAVLDAPIDAAFIRPFDPARLPEFREASAAARRCLAGQHQRLLARLEHPSVLVINRVSAQASNMSKPWQLTLLRRLGVPVPETLCTTDAAVASAFIARHADVVFKSISGVRSIVRRLTAEDMGRLGDVASCPTLFQEYVPGADVRVHVVGGETFATMIASDADDYRYDPEACQVPFELPAAVGASCVRVTRALGLTVSGIDLRLRPDGGWVFLEVNPSPAFSCFEPARHRPIARAIAQLLVTALRPARSLTVGPAGLHDA
jgi:glutathione synthase/RimK-type ligase-like ATP-grasp enzyme